MAWWKRWQGQLSHGKVSGFANLLFWLGVVLFIMGSAGVPFMGWAGGAVFVTSLIALGWSDKFLPDYDKEKERD